jgi:hypothetical protein
MDAVLSGRAGVALLLEGDALSSIHVDAPEQVVPRRPADLPFLLGDARDLRFLEDVGLEDVARQLESAATRDEALHLALILLDPELSREVRQQAAEVLEELIKQETGESVEELGVYHHLKNVLYSEPLPEGADPGGAVSLCKPMGQTHILFHDLEVCQLEVRTVHSAWEALPMNMFRSAEVRSLVRAKAVQNGIFQHLAWRIAIRDEVNVEELLKTYVDVVSKSQLVEATHSGEKRQWGNESIDTSVHSHVESLTH